MRDAAATALVAVVGGYAVLHRLGARSGSTAAVRAARLPGDEFIDEPSFVTNHAATLPAPPEQVWPWLTQVGWHRGGWYTPRWVDRLLFPDNRPSADRLDPELVRDLRPGDRIPDGPQGTAEFVVEVADAPRVLVLHSRTHLPPGWDRRFGASLDWVWTFTLDPAPDNRTMQAVLPHQVVTSQRQPAALRRELGANMAASHGGQRNSAERRGTVVLDAHHSR